MSQTTGDLANHPGESGTQHPGGWTAIVLAGQRPGIDPLAHAFGQTYKALIPVGGMPMIRRVVSTLLATPAVGRILILAQEPAMLRQGLDGIEGEPRIAFAPSGAGISASIRQVAGGDRAPWPVLVTTADHPLLTPAMVEAFVAAAAGADVAVAMVESATILTRHPETRRTWLRFRDGAFSGANLFALGGPAAARALDLWAGAEQDRKKAIRLFWHFGPWLALRAITRTIGLATALRRAGRRLDLEARLVTLDFADAAIDVDKPADHALVERILAAREAT